MEIWYATANSPIPSFFNLPDHEVVLFGQTSLKVPIPIRESLPYKFQLAMYPIGVPAVLAGGAVALVLFPNPIRWFVFAGLLTIATVFAVVRRYWLPRIQSQWQLDMSGWLLFGLPCLSNISCCYWNSVGSTVSAAFLVLISAFGIIGNFNYLALQVFGIGGMILVNLATGQGWDSGQLHLAIIGPIYAVVGRVVFQTMNRQVYVANNELNLKIAELEREKQKREESERQLVQIQKLEGLGVLATGIAHDFNNNLHAIHAIAELMEMESSSEGAKQIQEIAMSASEVCKHMLTYAGKTNDKLVSLELVEFVRSMEPVLVSGFANRYQFSFDLPDEKLHVMANASGLQQSITRLVQNSIDSMDGLQGEVSIRVDRLPRSTENGVWRIFGKVFASPDSVMIEVADSGCGMSSQTLERAFDPYYTTKPARHGFGLSSTLGIARSFGGYMRCATQEGKGTRMQMVLPLQTLEVPTTPVPHPKFIERMGRVLLVDDDPMVRTSIKSLLQADGWSVTIAESGFLALELILEEQSHFDLLLVDYSMPEMTGIRLLEKLRDANIHTPFVLCSGYAEESILNRDGLKPNAFLTKPFSLAQLKNCLGEVVRKSVANT